MSSENVVFSNEQFSLSQDDLGQVSLRTADGQVHGAINAVRAFPVSAPEEGVSLVGEAGQELAWLPSLSELAAPLRALIEAQLQQREFMPEILRLSAVSSFATPSVWTVETDRGPTVFTLKGEEDIRRLTGLALLVADAHGVQYLLRDVSQLDRHSRKLLDRFL